MFCLEGRDYSVPVAPWPITKVRMFPFSFSVPVQPIVATGACSEVIDSVWWRQSSLPTFCWRRGSCIMGKGLLPLVLCSLAQFVWCVPPALYLASSGLMPAPAISKKVPGACCIPVLLCHHQTHCNCFSFFSFNRWCQTFERHFLVPTAIGSSWTKFLQVTVEIIPLP